MKSAFLACDPVNSDTGDVKKIDLYNQLSANNFTFPISFLDNLTFDMQVDPAGRGPDVILCYSKLLDIINLYS